MRKSEINFTIELDDENVPEKISWNASDKQGNDLSETKSLNISLWDDVNKNTLRIDLWTKEMPVHEMKQFYIDSLGGLAQSILSSTGDEFMASEMNALCEKFVEYLKKEMQGR
ncbi:gliding motility protein GldC [Fulvivirgaceae bacterium BMA10]|uniref:Gliding motility protein GldC n=1 Tax=Splendidivirga corallicola TaxID=3051826 RepID=A0ABT8KJS5_9BACT|nr:gliding motility protein GldC [Fulvivirgaceae bacterium BMA10]